PARAQRLSTGRNRKRRKTSHARHSLYGVGERLEVEAADPQSWHHPSGGGWFGAANVFETVQHQERALVPAKVLERAGNLPFVDKECAVACQPRLQHGSRIERADIKEMRHEDAALASDNELLGSFGPARKHEPSSECVGAGRLHSLFLCPEPAVRQVLQDSALDPDDAADGKAFGIERLAEQPRIGRI